jgi:hypothetical protein
MTPAGDPASAATPGFAELQEWALEWKERIGTLYHLNRLRLEQWNPERCIGE